MCWLSLAWRNYLRLLTASQEQSRRTVTGEFRQHWHFSGGASSLSRNLRDIAFAHLTSPPSVTLTGSTEEPSVITGLKESDLMWTGGGGRGRGRRSSKRDGQSLPPGWKSAAGWAFVWRLSEAALWGQVDVEVRRRQRQKRGPFMEAGKEVWEGCSWRNKRALCSHTG